MADNDWLLPAAVLGGIGLMVLLSPSEASASPLPILPPPTPPPPGTPVSPPTIHQPLTRTGYASNGSPVLGSPQMQGQLLSDRENEVGQRAPSPDRVQRLRNDAAFLRAYAFQSLANSTYLTDALPDGLVGDHTRDLVRQVQRLSGERQTGVLSDRTLRMISGIARQRLVRGLMPAVDLRQNAEWLPSDVVSIMNNLISYPMNLESYTPIQTFHELGYPYSR